MILKFYRTRFEKWLVQKYQKHCKHSVALRSSTINNGIFTSGRLAQKGSACAISRNHVNQNELVHDVKETSFRRTGRLKFSHHLDLFSTVSPRNTCGTTSSVCI